MNVGGSDGAGRTRRSTVPKGKPCWRAASRPATRPMLPAPLAPLDPQKTRALTTIYAPRKFRTRPTKTAETRMIENDIKPTLSPFRPLPDIGQTERTKTKVIVFDLKKNDSEKSVRVLKPLTPLRIHGLKTPDEKPQLLRENTYEVLEPVYLSEAKLKKRDSSRKMDTRLETEEQEEKVSPKTRFKNAALKVAKLSAFPETGKLLCLRERQTFNLCLGEDNTVCRLERLPRSPARPLNKLSEIFQTLEMKGRHRDKMKKENSWF